MIGLDLQAVEPISDVLFISKPKYLCESKTHWTKRGLPLSRHA